MATGNYGTVRPSDVSPNDMEIYYTFSADRADGNLEVVPLDATQVMQKLDHPDEAGRILGGMYNLRLPTSVFNTKGFYNVMIRPREIATRIQDCGVLSAKPDIRGVIFDLQDLNPSDANIFENGGLVGYRIEYKSTQPNVEEKKVQNVFRVITSNFKVEPVSENLTNTTQKNLRYRLNENSTLIFCTVSPSSAPTGKPNAVPFIGNPNQEVILTNTFFDPVMVEVEMVEHDFDTLAVGLFGNQTFAVKEGIRTFYTDDNQIYRQFNEYVIKDDLGEERLFEVKEEREEIDFNQNFEDITDSVQ